MHRLGCLLVVVGLLVASCGDEEPSSSPPSSSSTPADPSELPDADEPLGPNAVMERVVDGDTIIVQIQGENERVRLLGIDTPESVAENRPDQCYGEESSDFLVSLLPPGTPLTLIRDVEPRDQYDRLLAYVVRSDDQLFVNLHIVEHGFADALIYEPNDHYADVIEDAARAAARAGLGLWGVCGGPDVPLE